MPDVGSAPLPQDEAGAVATASPAAASSTIPSSHIRNASQSLTKHVPTTETMSTPPPFSLDNYDFTNDFGLAPSLDDLNDLNLFVAQSIAVNTPTSVSSSNPAEASSPMTYADSINLFQQVLQNQQAPDDQDQRTPQDKQSPFGHQYSALSEGGNGAGTNGNSSGPLTLQDLQRLLTAKDLNEPNQSYQTSVLRQQLEALQRMSMLQQQQQQQQNQQQTHQQHQQTSQPSTAHHSRHSSSSGGSPSGSSGGAAAAQGLLRMRTQSPNRKGKQPPSSGSAAPGSSRPTSTSSPLATFPPANSPVYDDFVISGTETSSSAAVPSTSVASQHGLITPLSSGAFQAAVAQHAAQGKAPPFLSPLTMPHGHQVFDMYSMHKPRTQHDAPFSPLESPAVTPASIFSPGSTGPQSAASEHIFFSPLTSPALRPQMGSAEVMLSAYNSASYAAHHPLPSPQFQNPGGSTTPTASPLALMGRPGPTHPPAAASASASSSRRNRSVTAEAKASKVRPSPLMKPTTGSTSRRKKDAAGTVPPSPATMSHGSIAGNVAVSSRRGSISHSGTVTQTHSRSGSLTNHGRADSTAAMSAALASFAPFVGSTYGSDESYKPMDASPDGAISTPSPIDLSASNNMPPPAEPSNLPMTPGSIMGIVGAKSTGPSMGLRRSRSGTLASASASTSTGATAASPSGSAKVLTSILPNPLSAGSSAPTPAAAVGRSPSVGATTRNKDGKSAVKKPAYTGGPAGPRAQAGGGRTKKKVAKAVEFSGKGEVVDVRRTSHKAAEQLRRDSLKYCFDELRSLLPGIDLDESAPGGSSLGADGDARDCVAEDFHWDDEDGGETSGRAPGCEEARALNKGISKVALLRHSNEYLGRLVRRVQRRDEQILALHREVEHLRTLLGDAAPERSKEALGIPDRPERDGEEGEDDEYEEEEEDEEGEGMGMGVGDGTEGGAESSLSPAAALERQAQQSSMTPDPESVNAASSEGLPSLPLPKQGSLRTPAFEAFDAPQRLQHASGAGAGAASERQQQQQQQQQQQHDLMALAALEESPPSMDLDGPAARHDHAMAGVTGGPNGAGTPMEVGF